MKNTVFLLMLICSLSFSQTIEQVIEENDLKINEVEGFIKSNNLQIEHDDCISIDNPDFVKNDNYASQQNSENETQYVFNVYFHVINKTNGTRVVEIGEDQIMDAVALLNANFNQYSIFFKFTGYGSINDSDWTTINGPSEFIALQTYAKENGYYKNEAFNVFICEDLVDRSGMAMKPGTVSLIEDKYLLSSSLLHEVAHNFLIHHIYLYAGTPYCEYVNGSNSATRGDKITDTNASHVLDANGLDNIQGNADDEVVYHGGTQFSYNNPNNKLDCNDELYQDVQIANYMSSNSYFGVRNSFTEGQGVRMRESIVNYSNTIYSDVQNSISSLYQPYVGNYAGVNPNSNTATPLKFQKGFDYQFVYCNKTHVVKKQCSVNEIPIGHPYHTSIKILQVSSVNTENCNIPRPEAYNGGQIISSSNMYFDNYSIEEINAEEIQDADLIDNLNDGFYIIKTNYKNGETMQETIYKSN